METDGNDMVTYGNSFKVPVCYIIIDTLEILNRQEMEDRVIDLYYNKKKTYREIEKLVRKSPRDIRTILNKVEPPEHSMSVSSRAYKL